LPDQSDTLAVSYQCLAVQLRRQRVNVWHIASCSVRRKAVSRQRLSQLLRQDRRRKSNETPEAALLAGLRRGAGGGR
jgi:hypothetical protein